MNRNRSGRRYDREFKDDAVALVRGRANDHLGGARSGPSPNGRWGSI